VDKANGRASYALPYVSRISERVAHICAQLRIYNEKKKERERERERERESRGHYWILSIPGVIKIRSQPRGT